LNFVNKIPLLSETYREGFDSKEKSKTFGKYVHMMIIWMHVHKKML
jgi:hypothetical protein